MDIERDLNDARTLLSDSKRLEDGEKYRKAAKIILLKILNRDPAHAEARALLAEATPASQTLPSPPTPTPSPAPVTPEPPLPRREEFKFTAGYTAKPVEKAPPESSGGIGKLPIALTVMVVLGGGWFFLRPTAAARVVQAETAAPAPAPVPVPETAALPVNSDSALPPAPAVPVNPSPPAEAISVPVAKPAVIQEQGSLAVNSPIAADIYLGDKLVGSTPTTLSLPAGPVSLEYRHGNLRTVMTHQIKPKATTTALVSFDTTVQINARPWAQVFVEGSERRALGQTPLGSVRVPIGSVLTFENPNFNAKSYRITEKDSSIQIVFP